MAALAVLFDGAEFGSPDLLKGNSPRNESEGASGVMGGTTTMCAQQQRQPSPEHPSLESKVLWLEKMHESGKISEQAKISVAAMSSTKTVTTRRIMDNRVIESLLNMMPRTPLLVLRDRRNLELHAQPREMKIVLCV